MMLNEKPERLGFLLNEAVQNPVQPAVVASEKAVCQEVVHYADEEGFDIRKLLNPGTIASVTAILIFAFKIPVSAPVASLCEYMGNAAIPLSMMMIGVSLARLDLKRAFQGAENYIFLMVKMLAIPILAVLIVRQLPFNTRILGIFCITASMPVGGMVGMMAEEYGGNGEGEECNKAIAMTTILSAVTVPLVSLFF